ncbi:hypothetical protein B5X24_HaOG208779 [Helicoverpa armigera]|uniref:Uncharacterized protein n=1 Tax=Helicoverpa armigera TaxID=29058 RepID=A0A2W1BJF9_HELAM|nr:hypothetical protein B5X24_HaOG208779 [Helicoverpa armigera]
MAPDYYRVKTPEPEATDEDDEQNYEPEPLDPPPERPGDILMGNPWWSHERRIIVIQPNRQAEDNRQNADVAPERAPIPAQIAPVIQQMPVAQRVGQAAQRAVAQGAPRPLPQPIPQEGLAAQGPAPFVLGDVHIVPIPRPVPPAEPAAQFHAHRVDPELARAFDATLDEYGAMAVEQGLIRPGPANPQPGPANPQPGPANPQPGPANAQGSAEQPGPANPKAGAEEAGPSKRRANPEDPLDLAKRRRLDDDDDDDDEEMPAQRVQCVISAEQCPRLRDRGMVTDPPIIPVLGNRARVQIRHNNPFMHVDLETQRQSTIHIGNHIGYHLISDSAILRFGRAENDNINYVHIGRNGIHDGVEPGMRPDRSNLRILSVTGYRSVTDRSLQHLATAAPNLVSVDFTDTSVSSEGVAVFKAHRPNCEVIFNEWGRIYK